MVELPPTSPELHIIAAYARALERRFPGMAEEVFEDMESEVVMASVIKLRGRATEPAIRRAMELARNWLAAGTLLTAMLARKRRKA